MLAKGFNASSVDEVCKASGLSKGSFFHYFKSKEDLGKAVLHHYWLPMRRLTESAPFRRLTDPLARVYAYLDLVIALLEHPATPKACLFGNLSQELSTTHPDVTKVCAEAFTWWTESLQADLDDLKQQRAPHAPIDTRALATHFIAVYEGSLILAKASGDLKVVRTNIEHFKHYIGLTFSSQANTGS
jgi:TetR/AcrR family transcriptional repressor of nem operon